MTTTAPPEYAGPVSRMIAYVLDTLIVSVIFTGVTVALGMMASFIGAEAHRLALAAASAYLIVLPAILAIYCGLFWLLAGRTPGMALLGLRVVAVRSRPMSWLSAFVRALVLAYFPIGALWALVDRRRQAVHDKLARTTVIRVIHVPRG
jgi:uncharacterized RDD family membrane protein YckC